MRKVELNNREFEIIIEGLEWYLDQWYSQCKHSEKEIVELMNKLKEK